jgi:TPR repeat protein
MLEEGVGTSKNSELAKYFLKRAQEAENQVEK